MSASRCCTQNCRQGSDCPERTVSSLQNVLSVVICAGMLASPVVMYVMRTGGFH